MAVQLSPEELVTLLVRKERGQSNVQIAQTLAISEATVRYPAPTKGKRAGRATKPRKAAPLAQVIAHWIASSQSDDAADAAPHRPANVHALHDWLCSEHGYKGSYRSVLRFVRAHYPQPRLRPFRRVETPPGAQAQVDWGEFADLDVGDGPQKLYAFVMVLSHSRKAGR